MTVRTDVIGQSESCGQLPAGVPPGTTERVNMDWRVFFIGPMSPPFDQNLPCLRTLVVNYLVKKRGYRRTRRTTHPTVVRSDDRITIIIPQDDRLPSGSIPHSVFHQIDNADLVVADLTGGRTAVAYELAMAHALGVYTALVGKKPSADLMFYLRQLKLLEIDLTDPAYASPTALPPPEIADAIDRWLTVRHTISGADNPFSQFYGAPLYDISAASGLAAGFYMNFALPILLSGRLASSPPDSVSSAQIKGTPRSSVRGLIVLRPDGLTQKIPEVEDELELTLRRAFGDREIPPEVHSQATVQTDQGVRTAFRAVQGFVIDIPRTIFSLIQCYRLQRLKDKLVDSDPETRASLSSNMQEILIDRFFDDLQRRAERDENLFQRRKLMVGTCAEIPELLGLRQPTRARPARRAKSPTRRQPPRRNPPGHSRDS